MFTDARGIAQLLRMGWYRPVHAACTAEDRYGLDIYFCDPHIPWQRGTNENTNGLLRQYFPKGTDLNAPSKNALQAVALALNTRSRKTLGWKTPAGSRLTSICDWPKWPLR